MTIMLKPQDIVVLLKLIVKGKQSWSYSQLAHELAMSPAEVHAGVKRLLAGRLAIKSDDAPARPVRQAVEEFLVHGLKYAFPPKIGGMTRGVITASFAPPLDKLIVHSEDFPPVWPDPDGTTRGYEFSPLYRSVPKAAANDPGLYELLALVDAIRSGGARERKVAENELRARLG